MKKYIYYKHFRKSHMIAIFYLYKKTILNEREKIGKVKYKRNIKIKLLNLKEKK